MKKCRTSLQKKKGKLEENGLKLSLKLNQKRKLNLHVKTGYLVEGLNKKRNIFLHYQKNYNKNRPLKFHYICENCTRDMHRTTKNNGKHTFCSYECRNGYYSGKNSFNWKHGKSLDTEYRKHLVALSKSKVRQENKKRAVELLGGKCCRCDYSKYIGALQFHHVNPAKKDYTLKDLLTLAWWKIEKELKKCILVCANCHFEIHHNINRKRLITRTKNLLKVTNNTYSSENTKINGR